MLQRAEAHGFCILGRMDKTSKLFRAARRQIPLFPIIPLVPLAFLAANVTALVTLFRRLHRLEARAS
jgi:hypothetical protein